MTSTDTLTLRTFQAIGITASAIFAGKVFSYSAVAVPMMKVPGLPAALAARQWQELYDIGKTLALGFTFLSVLSNTYVLYRAHYSWPAEIAAPGKEWLIAAIFVQALFPVYTALFMETGTNKRMAAMARSAKEGRLVAKVDEQRVASEVDTWRFMHNFRVPIPAVAAVLAFVSTLA